MLQITNRRLHLRATQQGTDAPVVSWEDIRHEEAIIVLGDPGIGKTTFLTHVGGDAFRTVREFIATPQLLDVVFLDALDEYRATATGLDQVAELTKALINVGRPNFRLSCRAGDWFGDIDRSLLSAAAKGGRLVVVELLPLSKEEILAAVSDTVANPQTFFDEAEQAGLNHLLGNPQSLELIAKAWGSGKTPRNKFEAFEFGTTELLKEPNRLHGVVTSAMPTERIRAASGTAASAVMLSNSAGLVDGAPEDGYIEIANFAQSDVQALKIAVHRRIFTSRATRRFEFAHRTIAEFLAAQDLSLRVTRGLPIERVLTLLCADDGKPAASLRGLFAWFICSSPAIAEAYLQLDPYAVATYGDATALPPKAQRALWQALANLSDPWFLSSEEDRSSFRGLANRDTADQLEAILATDSSSTHLKITALEAIAATTADLGLSGRVRRIALDAGQALSVRKAAIRAFVAISSHERQRIDYLDLDLASPTENDSIELRIALVLSLKPQEEVTNRIVSILRQASAAKPKRHVIGRLSPLWEIAPPADLNLLLDSSAAVLGEDGDDRYELRSLYEKWLSKRFSQGRSIDLERVTVWIESIQLPSDDRRLLSASAAYFRARPADFVAAIRKLLARHQDEFESWHFLNHKLWKAFPREAWPVSPEGLLLDLASEEADSKKSAEIFRTFVSRFSGSAAEASRGFEFIASRTDIEGSAGKWRVCEVGDRILERQKRREKRERKEAAAREANIRAFTSRLEQVRDGRELGLLVWAAPAYFGLYSEVSDIPDPRGRIAKLTNDDIAGAVIEGYVRLLDNPGLPDAEAILASSQGNSRPYLHVLPALSTFLRASVDLPEMSIPKAFASVLTTSSFGDRIEGFDSSIRELTVLFAQKHQLAVAPILLSLWSRELKKDDGYLRGYHELLEDSRGHAVLISAVRDAVRATDIRSRAALRKLISTLAVLDKPQCVAVAEQKTTTSKTLAHERALWQTVLFLLNADGYKLPRFSKAKLDVAWECLAFLRDDAGRTLTAGLTPQQRFEIIRNFGAIFPNQPNHPESWVGDRNSWDAAQFVAEHIQRLAADDLPAASMAFERLLPISRISSYRDVMQHQIAQRKRRLRERAFKFPTAPQVLALLSNGAPATPADFLALVFSQLQALAFELTRTQRERFRAYWNEDGKKLIAPKHEEVCSGLLAEDLQARLRPVNIVVTVEHHMVADKECDLVALKGVDWILPIEVKHHFNRDLWTSVNDQLDRQYSAEAAAHGNGIFVALWSGVASGKAVPSSPIGDKPSTALELMKALREQIPERDRGRLRVIVVEIIGPPAKDARSTPSGRRSRSIGKSTKKPRRSGPARSHR